MKKKVIHHKMAKRVPRTAVTGKYVGHRPLVKSSYSSKRALAALDTIQNIGDEQEQRESLEYLQSVLHEHRTP